MPDSLALALQARQKDLTDENAWYGAGNQIMRMDSVNPMASVQSNLAAALIKGLGGSIMQNLGQYDVGQQLATDEQILNDIKYGRQPAQGTIWQERYEPYLNSYAQEKAEAQLAQQQKMQNLMLNAYMTPPSVKTVEQDGKKVSYMFSPVEQLAQALRKKPAGQGVGVEGVELQQPPMNEMEAMGFKKIAESSPKDKNPYGSVPNDLKLQVMQAPAMLEEFDSVEKGLRAYGKDDSKFPYVAAKLYGASDAYALQKRIDLLTANLKKAFEGARSSDFDQKVYTNLLSGNYTTLTANDVANLIGQAKNILASKAINNMDTIEQLKQDPTQVRSQLERFTKPNSSMSDVNIIQEEGLPSAPSGYMWRRKAR
jgi:hypothetical protein